MPNSKREDANANNVLFPRPIVVPTSGTFDGNDGRWSTFLINVGDDGGQRRGQNFRVLISTSSPLTLLPKEIDWCRNNHCANARGIQPFNGKQPLGHVQENGWSPQGMWDVPMPDWYPDDFFGKKNESLGATWGEQNVALGESSPQAHILQDKWVAETTNQHLYMGSFGMAVGSTSPIGSNGESKENFFSTFSRDDLQPRLVASASYGYTAGASYANNGRGVQGNLVLGGYDRSRLADEGISISMPSQNNLTLAVGVHSIMSSPPSSGQIGFTEEPFEASIDSTFPYLVFPDDVCDRFVKEYGLEYDEKLNLYTVNKTIHDINKRKNATVTFKIGESSRLNSKSTNIVLPYFAFDLTFQDPVNGSSVSYFPIKKSKKKTYVLGRTFLQEAYIVVDYQRYKFTVAQTSFGHPPPPADLVLILEDGFKPPETPQTSDGNENKLPTGAVAGIVVGIVLAFVLAGLALFCFWKKRKAAADLEKHGETSEINTDLAGEEIRRRRISELTGSEILASPKGPLQDYWSIDHKSVPPISEMSPDSPPAELYSPPLESSSDRESRDYFMAGKMKRHNSGHNSPGTPAIHELPGDEGQFHTPSSELEAITPVEDSIHNLPKGPARVGPSDTSLATNIDERLAKAKKNDREHRRVSEADDPEPVNERPVDGAQTSAHPEYLLSEPASTERQPSHTRGLSETTVQSDTTVISQPTPEEEERWAREPRRPLSE